MHWAFDERVRMALQRGVTPLLHGDCTVEFVTVPAQSGTQEALAVTRTWTVDNSIVQRTVCVSQETILSTRATLSDIARRVNAALGDPTKENTDGR